MHRRVGLHQVSLFDDTTEGFIAHCRAIGIQNVTLLSPKLTTPESVGEAASALEVGGVRVECVNHLFATSPNIEDDTSASERLADAIEVAASLGAGSIYMVTGSRGTLDWASAARRFASGVSAVVDLARGQGVRLLVQTTSFLNADYHFAHTLDDTIALADEAGVDLCVDLHVTWYERALTERLSRIVDRIGLVKVCDYVLGDRSSPCRAVPGDGAIPLQPILAGLLDAGYSGVFDIEVLGPRVQSEGARVATERAADYVSTLLARLGA